MKIYLLFFEQINFSGWQNQKTGPIQFFMLCDCLHILINYNRPVNGFALQRPTDESQTNETMSKEFSYICNNLSISLTVKM